MKLETQAKQLSLRVESTSPSDGNDDQDSFQNYILSSSAKESVSCCAPSTGPDVNKLVSSSRLLGSRPAQSMQGVRRNPHAKIQQNQVSVSIPAVGTRVENKNGGSRSVQPPISHDNPSICGPRQMTRSSSHGGNYSNLQDELSNLAIHEFEMPQASEKEMKVRLKQECWTGIGSWSNDNPIASAGNTEALMEDKTDSESAISCEMFDTSWLERVNQYPSGSRGRRSSQPAASQQKIAAKPSSSTAAANTNQRTPQGYGTEDNDNDNDSDEETPKGRPRATSGDSDSDGPKLACPFHQNDPRFFRANIPNGTTFRSCSGPGFENISRLK